MTHFPHGRGVKYTPLYVAASRLKTSKGFIELLINNDLLRTSTFRDQVMVRDSDLNKLEKEGVPSIEDLLPENFDEFIEKCREAYELIKRSNPNPDLDEGKRRLGDLARQVPQPVWNHAVRVMQRPHEESS